MTATVYWTTPPPTSHANRMGRPSGFTQPRNTAAKPKQATATAADSRLEALKQTAASEIDGLSELTQQMVDMLFSYGEPGFQEVETAKYCSDVLRKNGFQVQPVPGIPTGWVASWGSGKPVIALGSDVDGLLGTNQKPGIPRQEPFVAGAPGHESP